MLENKGHLPIIFLIEEASIIFQCVDIFIQGEGGQRGNPGSFGQDGPPGTPGLAVGKYSNEYDE